MGKLPGQTAWTEPIYPLRGRPGQIHRRGPAGVQLCADAGSPEQGEQHLWHPGVDSLHAIRHMKTNVVSSVIYTLNDLCKPATTHGQAEVIIEQF